MLITDAQVHIWGADTPERPWPKRAEPQRPIPLGADDLLREMNEAGVDRCVLVPPSWEGDRNDLAIAAAKAHPDRFAIMGRFDPDAPGAKSQVAGWRKQPGMLGMRFTFHTPILLPILTGGSMDWVWSEAEKAGVRMMILVPHAYVPMIDKVAERYPGLSITMDHLSLTSHKYDAENFGTLDALLALAKRPNVAVKASALPCYTKDTYPYRSLEPYLRRVYDAFGPKRVFWGTDLSRSPIPYRQHVTWWMDEMPWLSAGDKEWIMGRGICEWLGWKLPS